jgi:histidinol phosphatase-like enzyme
MHREASKTLGLDPTLSYFVGDKIQDVLPALELGGHGVLVRTGYGTREEQNLPEVFQAVDDLLQAAKIIVSE